METASEYETQPQEDELVDESNDHAYFAMLPNMLDDMLDPYQYRLYAHLKRVCGESKDSRCWQSVRTMAEKCRMSVGKVAEVKQELKKMGLITITEHKRPNGGFPYHRIAIVNIWARNITHCQRASSPDEQASSPDEQASSPDEPKKTTHKKTTHKKTPERGADAPDADALFYGDEAPPLKNPAQEQVDRMRAKFGSDPFSVGKHCAERQAAEGEWTVPKHRGLSPQCAVYKEATGLSPDKTWYDDIDTRIPDDPESLHNWYIVCHAYVGCGWNKRNVQAMLDYYSRGEIPSTTPKDAKGASTPRKEPEPTGWSAYAELMKERHGEDWAVEFAR